MDSPWIYPLRDLGETPLDDGSPILRPTVPLRTGSAEVHRGVIDTGSPISVASTVFARRGGVDLDAEPIMEVPLGLGARFERLPIF